MKFLCVRCDEVMKLERAEGPEDGTLSAVFACAACGNRVAMLTNPLETQLVRALDVRIGGRSSLAEPMEFVRNMLASGRDAEPDAASPRAAPSRCPFSAVANLTAERPAGTPAHPEGTRRSGNWAIGESEASEQVPGAHLEIEELGTPSCPVAESPDCQIAWSPGAERRLERIPDAIRPMVRQGIEGIAAQRGYHHITEDIMDEIRHALGL